MTRTRAQMARTIVESASNTQRNGGSRRKDQGHPGGDRQGRLVQIDKVAMLKAAPTVPILSNMKLPLPQWIPPQLTQLVETAPSGPQWLHEIKLDDFRMAARIEHGQARLLTRTGLDWSAKYPSALTALAGVRAKTAYLDGELCGVGEDGLPNFAETQAATDGARGVRLVFYAFDLLHLDGRDTAGLPLLERKTLFEPIVAGIPGLQFNGHEIGDGELVRRHACQLGFEGIVLKTAAAHTRRAIAACGARQRRSTARSSSSSAGPTRKARGLIWARCSWATYTDDRETRLRRPRRHRHVGKGA